MSEQQAGGSERGDGRVLEDYDGETVDHGVCPTCGGSGIVGEPVPGVETPLTSACPECYVPCCCSSDVDSNECPIHGGFA